MSANGAFSTTLDFEFFAGGYATIAGEASVSIESSLVSYAKLPIAGTSNNVLDFLFNSTAVVPFIQGSAQNLSFNFTLNSILEFGVQRYATAELGSLVIPFTLLAQSTNVVRAYSSTTINFTSNSTIEFGIQRYATTQFGALLIPFTQSAQGYNLTHAYLNKTLDFTLDTDIYVFSLGSSVGSYDFSLESTALNISTRVYSRDGGNYYKFNGVNFNSAAINKQSNSVRIVDNGSRHATVLQKSLNTFNK